MGVAWLGAVVVFGGGCGDDGEGTGAGTGTDTATVGTTMVPSTVSDTSGASAPTEGSATGTSATVGSDSMDADSDATTSTGTTVSTGTSDTTGTTGTTGNTTGVLDTTDGTTGDTTGTTGDATGDTTGDTTGTTGDPIVCDTLPVVYRDFKPLHTDFGCHMFGNGARPGLVMQNIGNDNKPAYNPNPPAAPPGWNGSVPQITSGNSFSEWYNSKDGINMEIAGELQLMEIMPGIYSFSSNNFYPLTGMGFGNNVTPNWANEVYPDKNGSFTTEIHTNFIYEKGQTFNFSGDDDVWVFINGKLAMDLGGLHGPVQGAIMLDTLGLVEGQQYPLDAFHAERCDSGSNFRIDTSISCFVPQ